MTNMKKTRIIVGSLLIVLCVTFVLYRRLDRRNKELAIKLYYQAKTLDVQGKYDEALKILNKSIELDPKLGKAHLMLGVIYNEKEEYKKAVAEFKESLKYKMETVNETIAHHNLGAIYLEKLGLIDEAIAEFKLAIKTDPSFFNAVSDPHMGLAKAYVLKGKNDDAIKEAQESIRLNPKNEISSGILDELQKTVAFSEAYRFTYDLIDCLDGLSLGSVFDIIPLDDKQTALFVMIRDKKMMDAYFDELYSHLLYLKTAKSFMSKWLQADFLKDTSDLARVGKSRNLRIIKVALDMYKSIETLESNKSKVEKIITESSENAALEDILVYEADNDSAWDKIFETCSSVREVIVKQNQPSNPKEKIQFLISEEERKRLIDYINEKFGYNFKSAEEIEQKYGVKYFGVRVLSALYLKELLNAQLYEDLERINLLKEKYYPSKEQTPFVFAPDEVIFKTRTFRNAQECIFYVNNKEIARQKLDRDSNVIESSGAVPDGIAKIYYPDGKLWTEFNYKDNRREGTMKECGPNGKLLREITYSNNKPDGLRKDYDEEGRVTREINYKNGELEVMCTS